MWSDVRFLQGTIIVMAVALALLLALVRSFGRIAGATIDPTIVPADPSMSSRLLRWLFARKAATLDAIRQSDGDPSTV